MKLKVYASGVAILLLLGACAQLGIVPASTFNQRLAYGYGTVTSVRKAATELVKNKQMSAEEARKVLSVTDTARAYLDRATASGPSKAGLSELQFANELLLETQRLLEAKRAEAGRSK